MVSVVFNSANNVDLRQNHEQFYARELFMCSFSLCHATFNNRLLTFVVTFREGQKETFSVTFSEGHAQE